MVSPNRKLAQGNVLSTKANFLGIGRRGRVEQASLPFVLARLGCSSRGNRFGIGGIGRPDPTLQMDWERQEDVLDQVDRYSGLWQIAGVEE
jgi:hypothetical protein